MAELDLSWHFVGRLQPNKAGSVASYAAVVHSLDRPALVGALARGADRTGRDARGADPGLPSTVTRPAVVSPSARRPRYDGLLALAAAVAAEPALSLRGVMAVAPLGADPGAAFDGLARMASWCAGTTPRPTGSRPG